MNEFRSALAVVAILCACTPVGTDDPSGDGSSGSVDDGDGPAPVDGCAPPTGPGTDVSSTIDADQTWTAEGSPYRIAATTYVTATVTLQACTVVQLAGDAGLEIGNDPAPGAVVARGELADGVLRPVVFERLDPTGAWGSLTLDTTGRIDAEHTRFVGGGSYGAAQNGGGAILAYGVDARGATTPNVRLQHVEIAGAETHGINLQRRAAFTDDSIDLVISGTGTREGFPVYVEAGAVHSVPPELDVHDNADDVVLVHPFAAVGEDDTFAARGAAYRLDDALYLGQADGGPALTTLTIEAGVEIQFDQGAASGIYVGTDDTHLAQIVARGTADAPILLHSAESPAAPADWMGLYFRYTPASGNALEHVTIADAGAFSGAQGYGCGPADNDASILLLTDALDPFIHDCTFANAGGDTQLLIGWTDEASPEAVAQSFAEGNEFADAPGCRVSLPRDTDNGCPGDDATPDCL